MKEIKMKIFTFYWNEKNDEGKYEGKISKVVATDFATAIKEKFGDNIPDVNTVYSDEVTTYVDE